MANATKNVLTRYNSGRIGDLVYRQLGKITVVSKAPVFINRQWTKSQLSNQNLFRQAMAYAQAIDRNSQLWTNYQRKRKGNQTTINVIISDFMRKPEIQSIDVRNYKGKTGNRIEVQAWDKYLVAGVIITIINAIGFEVESGIAELNLSTGNWVYKTKFENPKLIGSKVAVRVTDSPGNVVQAFCTV